MRRLGFALALLFALPALGATGAAAQGDPAAPAAEAVDTMVTQAVDSTVALPPVPVPAAAEPASPAGLLGPNSPRPSRPHQLFPRTDLAIRGELDQFAMLASAADADLNAAKSRRAQAKTTVDIKKREIETLEARIKVAKKAQDEPTRLSFEAEKKRQESMREYFEKAENVEEAAMDEAKARGEYARASTRALQLERQLIGRAGIPLNDSDGALFKHEQQWFELRKMAASAEERASGKMQGLMDRKTRLYRAWADYLLGK